MDIEQHCQHNAPHHHHGDTTPLHQHNDDNNRDIEQHQPHQHDEDNNDTTNDDTTNNDNNDSDTNDNNGDIEQPDTTNDTTPTQTLPPPPPLTFPHSSVHKMLKQGFAKIRFVNVPLTKKTLPYFLYKPVITDVATTTTHIHTIGKSFFAYIKENHNHYNATDTDPTTYTDPPIITPTNKLPRYPTEARFVYTTPTEEAQKSDSIIPSNPSSAVLYILDKKYADDIRYNRFLVAHLYSLCSLKDEYKCFFGDKFVVEYYFYLHPDIKKKLKKNSFLCDILEKGDIRLVYEAEWYPPTEGAGGTPTTGTHTDIK